MFIKSVLDSNWSMDRVEPTGSLIIYSIKILSYEFA